jgi:ubiquinone/menaquinone biosynthesis C-methylase UbiE/uncharacterized protein YbaR (Trm112 family)
MTQRLNDSKAQPELFHILRCTRCLKQGLRDNAGGMLCGSCGALFPVRDGILDMLPDEGREVITPFQRIMQSGAVVAIYENLWRRIGYFLASSRSFNREMSTVLGFHGGGSYERVLDLACGPGVFTRPLARQARGVVVGFDLSWPMLRRARSMAQREGLRNVLFVRGTVFRLPFVDSAFSFVNCCGALHLFDRPDVALTEIQRVLAPEGRLCVQTTIRPHRSAGMAYLLERFIRFGFFDEEELQEKLRLNCFKLLKSERHRISYTFLAGHNSKGILT